MRSVLACFWCVCSLAVFASVPAKAETTVFENGLFFITEPTVFDDIYIGVGAVVLLDGDILVTGDIEVTDGAWLSASGISVQGEIEFEGAAIVDLEHSFVRGNVEVKRTGGEAVLGLLPSIFISDNRIGGNLQVKNNNVNSINIFDNKIGGKLELSRNVAKDSFYSNNVTNLKKGCK